MAALRQTQTAGNACFYRVARRGRLRSTRYGGVQPSTGDGIELNIRALRPSTLERQQMAYFLCKMTLPRSDFVQTMTDAEKNIMKAHGDYLQSLAELGSIVCHGPVDDPKGGWGLSIFSAFDQTEVVRLTAADPIILDDIGARYEILPMRQLRMKGAA
jgi:uncharacterized protein YciI